ncbi:atpase [Anaeramoeba ignava]|uniref:Atpase n=1 Tax=Anaeramoeba ignava TaxID=1746090 RepID=A0A9Q0LUX0_ANAIG|nr:atpase [Anaeramoeba ignava]
MNSLTYFPFLDEIEEFISFANKPYKNQQEFLQFVELKIIIKTIMLFMDNSILEMATKSNKNFQNIVEIRSFTTDIYNLLIKSHEKRKSLSNFEPIHRRICRKLKMSEIETDLIEIILVSQTKNWMRENYFRINLKRRLESTKKPKRFKNKSFYWIIRKYRKKFNSYAMNSLDIAESQMLNEVVIKYISGIAMKDVYQFFLPNRIFIKDHLVCFMKEYDTFFSRFLLSDYFMQALTGVEFEKEMMQEIYGTALHKILIEEQNEKINENINENIDEKIDENINENFNENLGDVELFQFIRQELNSLKENEVKIQNEEVTKIKEIKNGKEEENQINAEPFKSDFEYLSHFFTWMLAKIEYRKEEKWLKDYAHYNIYDYDYHLFFPILDNSMKSNRQLFMDRTKATLLEAKKTSGWIPRLEKLAILRKLVDFEKLIILFLAGVELCPWMAHLKVNIFACENKMKKKREKEKQGKTTPFEEWTENPLGVDPKGVPMATLLSHLCINLTEEIISRRYFYKTATLIKEGIVRMVSHYYSEDPEDIYFSLDQRLLDYIAGLDTESDELLTGTSLYFSHVKVEQVILPENIKKLIMQSTENFTQFEMLRKRLEFESVIGDSGGFSMMFYGSSGTGKTMMANALGNYLQRKILLVNFPQLWLKDPAKSLRLIFKEARIQNAILFFDECEQLFEQRGKDDKEKQVKQKTNISMMLTELDRFDGLAIFATNRPFDLDEAMHRRITLSIEFKKPDAFTREQIWKTHLPKEISYSEDIDITSISQKYELTGGLIRNAVLAALNFAISRRNNENMDENDMKSIKITQKDLEKASTIQLKNFLEMKQLYRNIIPKKGLESLFVEEEVMKQLKEIVNVEKTGHVLENWGFGDEFGNTKGTIVLFYGESGTGKTHAAHSIGFEIGKSLDIINSAELLSKYIGETTKNIDRIFQDARNNDRLLVFDQAEGLFGKRFQTNFHSSERYLNIDSGVLLYHLENFPGIVILCTNSLEFIDQAFFRRFHYMIRFDQPNLKSREKIWRKLIPKSIPRKEEFDFHSLAQKYILNGGEIQNAVRGALIKFALKPTDLQVLSMDDLIESAKKEFLKIHKNDFQMNHF